MVYCPKECRGTLFEHARINGQRLFVVEPSSNGIFVICEEPLAKAAKRI
ncbi:hypothetical protein ABIF39_008773 [Bradyrhizobium diazoefficiens]